MIKFAHDDVWVFDVEWVPDVVSGRLAYGLPEGMPDLEVLEVMWRQGGGSDEDPRPYLKTALCRVVSISVVIRRRLRDGSVTLNLRSIPAIDEGALDEPSVLDRFLTAVGKSKPQLVGFNSNSADVPILVQRGVAHGLSQAEFAHRPEKPWEGRDYFARASDWSIDLKGVLGGWGKATPSLHEFAASCGLPGKLGVDGSGVVDLWLAGDIPAIVAYNECDALTTYLVWLRLVHFAGLVTSDAYAAEQEQLRELLRAKGAEAGRAHLLHYLGQWDASQALRAGLPVASG